MLIYALVWLKAISVRPVAVYTYHTHDLKTSSDLISCCEIAQKIIWLSILSHKHKENAVLLWSAWKAAKHVHQWRDLLQRNGVSNCVFYSHTMFIKDTSKAARSYDDTTSKGPGVWVNRLRGRARHTRALGVRPTPRKEHPPTIITIGLREWEARGQAGGTGRGEDLK